MFYIIFWGGPYSRKFDNLWKCCYLTIEWEWWYFIDIIKNYIFLIVDFLDYRIIIAISIINTSVSMILDLSDLFLSIIYLLKLT